MTPAEQALVGVMRRELEPITAETHRLVNHMKDINGTVRRHNEEIFGDSNKGTRGLRLEMDEIHDMLVAARAAARTVKWLAATFGGGNLIALAVLVARTFTT